MQKSFFRNKFGEDIFNHKYRHEGCETWDKLADVLVEDVCRDKMSRGEKEHLKLLITEMKFIPGGRYLYYAGRPFKAFNNCFLLKCENDSREDWANLSWKAESCLMTGGGIGSDYSVYRPKNSVINRTGGLASGPVPKMKMINEIGREVMQGGSRRSAIYASLNWKHVDVHEFIHAKDWYNMKVSGTDLTIGDLKEKDFNFPAPLDMTNISVNYDTEWLENYKRTGDMGSVFLENAKQALSTGEPGFSFNFYEKEKETLRNACVSGKTRILTNNGYVRIEDVIGEKVTVWNGKEWSEVKPFSTGEKLVYYVTLSNGAILECTGNHEFILSNNERVRLERLRTGDKLVKWEAPVVNGGQDMEYAYEQGFYSGDGNEGYRFSWLYGEKATLPLKKGNIVKEKKRFRWNHGTMLDKKLVPFNASVKSRLQWLSGLIDADGTLVISKSGAKGVQIGSVDQFFLNEVRLMLTTLGITTSITQMREGGYAMLPDGKGGLRKYYQQPMHRLHLGNNDLVSLKEMGLLTYRVVLPDKVCKDNRGKKFPKVVSIEEKGFEETYCFTENSLHAGVFDGVLTGQCTEVTSEDDSDVCNLGSLNFANIESKKELVEVVELAMKFLICGTMVADLPYEKVYKVREKNRRIGLGLMGLHEWLLKRNYKYEMTDELREWMTVYKNHSDYVSRTFSDRLGISRPVANRAIAPTGSIGILAGTTTSAEPLIAVAYKRRYLKGRSQWVYQYVVDGTARIMIDHFGINPDKIETALDLASDYERRIKFQADLQDYVDMSISSTINLPAWGSDLNNEGEIVNFAKVLAKYAHRLRGFTCYPDGARGGQPLTPVPYKEAILSVGQEFEEEFFDICDLTKGGVCGS